MLADHALSWLTDGMSDSLYEKLGGEAGITSMVGDFYNRVKADDLIGPFFNHVDMNRLLSMQKEFFSMALGGPVVYSGRPLSHAHHNMGIERKHFQRFVECLFQTLESQKLSQEEKDAIISRVDLYADEIIGMGTGNDG
jgi:hemoglobin